MGPRRRGRAIAIVLVAALAVLATSCQWTQPDFSAAHTRYNITETSLGAENAAGLHHLWSAEDYRWRGTPIVFAGKVFVTASNVLQAYDLLGLEGCGGSPTTCQPLWEAHGVSGQPFAYGDRIYAAGTGIEAFDPDGVEGCSGTPVVCQPLAVADLGGWAPTPADGEIYVAGVPDNTSVTAYDDDVLAGCVGPCQPLRTYESGCVGEGLCELSNFAVEGDQLVMMLEDWGSTTESGMVAGFDRWGDTGCSGVPVTCEPTWSHWLGRGEVALADGSAIVAASVLVEDPLEEEPDVGTAGVHALDQATGVSQWASIVDTPDGFYSGWVAVGGGLVLHKPVTDSIVRIYPLDAAGCTTSCPPSRVADYTGVLETPPVAANGLLYVATSAGIQVFDATGANGCAGSPVVCTPLVTLTAPGAASYWDLVVGGGKVIAVDSDQDVHVFGLG